MNEAIERELKPKTFEELKQMTVAQVMCRRCGQKQATHAISMSATEKQAKRGVLVATIKKVPVCEPCGTDLFVVIRKALRL